MVSHTPAKSGGHRHHGSGDIMVLVCHVILQDLAIKGFHDFMGSSLWAGAHLDKLSFSEVCWQGTLVVEIALA